MGTPSTPARYQSTDGITVGGWTYEADEQTAFAFVCSLQGFGLPAFDDFVDSLPDNDNKAKLLEWREAALQSFKKNDNEKLKAHLETLWANWRLQKTITHAAPYAKRGKAFMDSTRGLSPLYRVALEILREEGHDFPARDVWNRFIDMAADGHPIIQEVDADGVYVKGASNPTKFSSFQTQLSAVRKKVQ